ncbi:MAG: hypothetical protein RIS70_4285 [Planctomycetota bacterium]
MRANLLILLVAIVAGGKVESLEERRQRVEAMSAEKAAELLDKKDIFYALPQSRQNALRALHRSMEQDPRAEQLDRILGQYYKLLLSLPSTRREELLKLPAEQRLARIQEIVLERESRHRPEDISIALRWLDEFILSHETTIIEPIQENLEKLPEGLRRRIQESSGSQARLLIYFVHLRQGAAKVIPQSDDFEELYAQLSPGGVRELQVESSDGERLSKIMRWVFQAGGRMPSQITEEESRFYLEKLSKADREKLSSYRGEQFRRRLRDMFMNYQFRRGEFPSITPPREGGATGSRESGPTQPVPDKAAEPASDEVPDKAPDPAAEQSPGKAP